MEKCVSKELFIDQNDYNREFRFFIVDHDRKLLVPYVYPYLIGLYDVIFKVCDEFDIKYIGLYGIRGGMLQLYDGLLRSGYFVYDTDTIYRWRMGLDSHTRNVTHPDYYYYAHGYAPISETDYKKIEED